MLTTDNRPEDSTRRTLMCDDDEIEIKTLSYIKRGFDLGMAFAGLVLLLPIWIGLSLWVRWDSAGPIFFRQWRVGRNGRLFLIYKFRTMYAQPLLQQGLPLTVGHDPRITPLGQRLRPLKIDELPQLINVFLGHMSFVGPRPEVPCYVEFYPPEVRRTVLSVRPGLTDLASIRFRSEQALLATASDPEQYYKDVLIPAKLQYHLAYVRRPSFWGDLGILIQTAFVLIKEAYAKRSMPNC